jgi:predicted nucleotidyltransferase
MKLERALHSITDLIVQCCDPEAILLFGSYAKGQDSPDSDLDILVIGDFRESPYLRGREIRELLRRYPIRIDLHLVTPEEMKAESRKPYGFLHSVLASSVMIYQKSELGY